MPPKPRIAAWLSIWVRMRASLTIVLPVKVMPVTLHLGTFEDFEDGLGVAGLAALRAA